MTAAVSPARRIDSPLECADLIERREGRKYHSESRVFLTASVTRVMWSCGSVVAVCAAPIPRLWAWDTARKDSA